MFIYQMFYGKGNYVIEGSDWNQYPPISALLSTNLIHICLYGNNIHVNYGAENLKYMKQYFILVSFLMKQVVFQNAIRHITETGFV